MPDIVGIDGCPLDCAHPGGPHRDGCPEGTRAVRGAMRARTDAHPLIAALEAADLEVEPYSGRGMYGRTCASANADPWEVAAAAVEGATEETREEIAEALRATRTDSLGLGTVCYWPRLAAPTDEAGQ